MLESLEIIIIAVVQGIGEFLPISSSAHISLTQKLFEVFGGFPLIKGGDLDKLEVALHIGTLIPVLVIFWRVLFDMLVKDRALLFKIIVATIPAVAVGLPIKKMFPDIAENFYVIGTGFIITGFILLSTLKSPNGEKTCKTIGWLDAILIGCMQAVATLPGISRFGSTTFMGLFRKLEWREAIKFSFLLSIPVVAGTGLLELIKILKVTDSALSNSSLLLGMLVSCVFGFLTLSAILRFLPKKAFACFAVWVFLMSPLAFYLATLPAEQSLPNEPEAVQTQNTAPTEVSKVSEASEISVLDLPAAKQDDKQLRQERERILAEEKANEQQYIEEERKMIPLVDDPQKLVPLDKDDRIWITADQKQVVLLGRVAFREGLLELLACRVRTKEHESILSVRVKPYLIHAGLLLIQAKQGKPMQSQTVGDKTVFTPASGDRVDITLRWKDADNKTRECAAQDWIWDASASKEDAKKPMSTFWVFSGSTEHVDDEGKTHYLANESGELFGLSNFVGSILDIPIQSTDDNTGLKFACFTEHIPPLETPVTIILSVSAKN